MENERKNLEEDLVMKRLLWILVLSVIASIAIGDNQRSYKNIDQTNRVEYNNKHMKHKRYKKYERK